MACVAVNSLVRTLELEFLQPRPRPVVLKYQLISHNSELIRSLHQKLESLIELFDENRMEVVKEIKELERKLRDVAFEVEDEIELLIVHLCEGEEDFGSAGISEEESLKLGLILQKAIEDIDAIEEELVKVKAEYEFAKAMKGRKTAFDAFARSDDVNWTTSNSSEKMVGKNDDLKTVMEMLTNFRDKKLKVIPIEGMGGIGKTTLAKTVYEHPSIVNHFDVRAWTVASQQHNRRCLVVDLLKSVSREKISDNDSDGDLALRLKQVLMGKRYLIVLDDLWSCDAWDALKTCFTDHENGSRVLLSTRIAEVAEYTCSNNELPHQMQLLDQEESWNLFCEKTHISCNAELETIWRPIVVKSKGLPLAIVAVAGLFSKLSTTDERNSIVEALYASATATMDEECSRILSLSYNHLPHYLKACFLYLAVFPEDKEINANELVRLWSAEGLVKGSDDERYDQVAKRYIQELKDRNLIIVSQLSCCGRKIKSFRMHDMLHSLCTREAQNENLVHVVGKNGFDSTLKCFRWVSFPSGFGEFPKNYLCRSIFYFQKPGCKHIFHLTPFNLLRVLHGCLCDETDVNLVHLRYIKSDSCKYLLRRSSAWNLQTLSSLFVELLITLELPQYQYIGCYDIESAFCPREVNQNLHSICWLRPRQCTEEFLTKMPNLNKICIRCAYGFGRLKENIRDVSHLLENLGHLRLLNNLGLMNIGLKELQVSNNIFVLKNLKKLHLSSDMFEWSEINVFCKLPTLEVFKITKVWPFVEGGWELLEDDKFCNLIVLKIHSPRLKHWEANADNFPKLEHLFLTDCYILREIPEIPTLKLIKLEGCHFSAVDSAKQIQQEQYDLGNEDMLVIDENTLRVREQQP